jgi:hypothetical protein
MFSFVELHLCKVGWDSIVGIVTRYGLDGPGIESQWGRDFSHLFRSDMALNTHPL